MRELGFKPSSEAAGRPGVASLGFATLGIVLVGLAALSHAGNRANDREARQEQSRVLDAVERQRDATARDVAALASSLAAGSSRPAGARLPLGSLGGAFELNGSTVEPLLVSAGDPTEDPDLKRQLSALAKDIAERRADRAGAMVEARGDLYDTVATPLPQSDTPMVTPSALRTVIVGMRKVDSSYLGDLALAAGTRGLKLARMPSGPMAEDGSVLPNAWSGFGFTWQPDRPGDRLVIRWTIAIVGLAAVLAVLLIMRARRFTGDLYASEARAVEASNCDWLSGLPNRVYFNHVLERELKAVKQGAGKLALFYLDLDRFRDINDSFGIELGDRLIQIATQRIADVLRQGDVMARFEGDAFLILQLEVEGTRDCEVLAERILSAMKNPFEIDGTRVSASLSIGVAIAPDDASDQSDLVRLANVALYRAKREGRNRLAFYKPAMEDDWRRRKATELQLRQAIDHGGLLLRYQPIVSCETGQIVCVEALVRWQHPTEGLIAPDHFIGLAEDRGLILPLGEWVMRQACKEARQWPGIRVAVNVSPIQFRHRDFVHTVGRVLADTGLDPSRLELELTEGVLVENEEEAADAIGKLRDQGVRLALDDFGTGYSSLIYLRRFSFDKIKIDKAFIEALEPVGEGAILVESVISLGRALGLTVTAEGVETPGQQAFLRSLGCHELQGYLIARPMSGPELSLFLAQDAAGRRGAAAGDAPAPQVQAVA